MNVLVVEPYREPYEKEIDPGLESLRTRSAAISNAFIPSTIPWA